MRSADTNEFGPGAYDEYVCVTPGLLFWLTSAFILRPFIVLIASITDRANRFGLLDLLYPDHIWALLHTAAALPTLAVVIAYSRRLPRSGAAARWTWHHGLWLLLASLALNIAFLAVPWLQHDVKFTTQMGAQIAGCAVLAYLLLRSRRVRASFADFPALATTK